jgi:DNA-binding SARP family transcriptional activator
MMINPISAKLPKIETPPVVISFFGAFSVQVNGQPIASFRSAKARGLLAYLLLTRPQPLLRATLLDLLWSGYGAESALTSLRQALANVRSRLKPFDLLQADRYHVHLAVDPTIVWCDALHFDALLDACQHHAHRSLADCPTCQERLQQALSLYKGPFLHNLPAVDSAPFTTWLHAQQSYFAERVAALQTLLASVTARGNLPQPLTTLIGRTIELKELVDKALDPVYRCLTLIGPGGIGKTRLAIALGTQVQPHFPDGIWLVKLSGVAPAMPDEAPEQVQERLATAIGQALNLTFYGAQPPTTQVANYLAERTALLILDSFEHLTAGAASLLPLLTAAARATYEAVSTLSQQNNLPAYLLPLQAYRAAVDLAQGEVATAYAAIEPLLAHFADTPFMPSQRPQELLLIAYQILLANADPRADGVLQIAALR